MAQRPPPILTAYHARCLALQSAYRQQGMSGPLLKQFTHILAIDTDQQTATVEGFATYGSIVKVLRAAKFIPRVIPALKSTTLADSIIGLSVNAGAFSSGPVIESVLECDVLLPNGDIVTCRRNNDCSDVFYALPNSLGRAGIILRAVIAIRPMKKFVAVTHQHFNRPAYFIEKLVAETSQVRDSVDFIEATVFGERDLVITRAQFVDEAPYINEYKILKQYYYSVQNRQTDFMLTKNFLWRWNSDRFWRPNKHAMTHLNTSSVTRRRSRAWLKRFQRQDEVIMQDVFMPADRAFAFLESILTLLPIRPLWLCPLAMPDASMYPNLALSSGGAYVYFGFWGAIPQQQTPDYYSTLITEHVQSLGGMQTTVDS